LGTRFGDESTSSQPPPQRGSWPPPGGRAGRSTGSSCRPGNKSEMPRAAPCTNSTSVPSIATGSSTPIRTRGTCSFPRLAEPSSWTTAASVGSTVPRSNRCSNSHGPCARTTHRRLATRSHASAAGSHPRDPHSRKRGGFSEGSSLPHSSRVGDACSGRRHRGEVGAPGQAYALAAAAPGPATIPVPDPVRPLRRPGTAWPRNWIGRNWRPRCPRRRSRHLGAAGPPDPIRNEPPQRETARHQGA
jgi:hypothetical protein